MKKPELEVRPRTECPCMTRRRFLERGAQSVTAVMLSTGALSLLSSCGQKASNTGNPAGPAIAIANSGTNSYNFAFSQFPSLQNTGGSVHVSVAATSGTQDLFVTRVNATTAIAVSTICTHQGSTLDAYDATNQQYLCESHGSIFGSTGAVIQGPANQALQSYSGTIGGSGITFTIA